MYIISYDLKSPQADYEGMKSAIESQGQALRILESTWILDSSNDEDMISAALRKVIHEGDRYIVVHMDKNKRQGWLAKSMWEWMRLHERNNTQSDE